MKKRSLQINTIIGLLLFTGVVFLIPDSVFSLNQRYVLATLTLMIYWWITAPVDLAVTALLPIVINSILLMTPMKNLLQDYFSSIVVLIIGANILMATWAFWKLDKRIALKALSVIGVSVNQQIIVWFIISAVLSMFLPNVVVVTALCPIAFSMMKYCMNEGKDEVKSTTLFLILLSITWGTGIGGAGTPLGGAMNLVVIEYLEGFIGKEFLYIDWVFQMVPLLIILSAAIIVYLLLIKKEVKHLPGSKIYFKEQLQNLGKITKPEQISLILFLVSLILAFTRPLYQTILPNLQPQYVFLMVAMISFFIKVDKENQLITWSYAVKNIKWGLILLFSGGLAIGNLIVSSEVASRIASLVSASGLSNHAILLSVFIALGLFLANTSSNTAACAVLIPIVIGITKDLNYHTIAYVFITAASCNAAYALPTSIRAVPVEYGLDSKFLFKKGMVAILISFIVLLATGYMLVTL